MGRRAPCKRGGAVTPETEVAELRAIAMDHEGRIASLESFRDNERTRHASTPAWLFGAIAAFVSIVTLLLSLLTQIGGRP